MNLLPKRISRFVQTVRSHQLVVSPEHPRVAGLSDGDSRCIAMWDGRQLSTYTEPLGRLHELSEGDYPIDWREPVMQPRDPQAGLTACFQEYHAACRAMARPAPRPGVGEHPAKRAHDRAEAMLHAALIVVPQEVVANVARSLPKGVERDMLMASTSSTQVRQGRGHFEHQQAAASMAAVKAAVTEFVSRNPARGRKPGAATSASAVSVSTGSRYADFWVQVD